MRSRVRSIAARVEEDMNARTKGRLTAASEEISQVSVTLVPP